MSKQMSTVALMRYMQTCNKKALCSITIISELSEDAVFELNWNVEGEICAKVFREGDLRRDGAHLQRVFNEVRRFYDNK